MSYLSGFFRVLIILLLLYAYHMIISNLDFIQSTVVYLLLFAIVLIVAFWIANKLDLSIDVVRFPILIRIIVSCLIILFFCYSFFTTHFYTDKQLIETGLEKIEMYYQLNQVNFTDEERQELLDSIFHEQFGYSVQLLGKYPEAELVEANALNITRNFYQYNLLVKVELSEGGHKWTEKYMLILERDGFTFKLNGMSYVD
ncbi:hypothetical protein NC661_18010 [Aquibacillus koreensis]|uniref:Uncharacterized protein n=1 Tax=Aquibacillus koreensis TaxID=279446 RepID=A0A9X3WP08_9BACI|nr:hypothetical protein [Aquibacillus koreensis]MCT2535413.1 hypothetical protein [Aquibacillus koreensis]MDC3422248.1 hypothetical protein [Aquibacillus koreensis]